MSDKTKLGDRMKEYESVPKLKLMRKQPVIIRLDGKAFHTFTRDMKRPFDDILSKTMEDTMRYLCENIQGCVLGYTQSDEITLLLIDYKNVNSSAWFDYNVQKMCSVSASMATLAFNTAFSDNAIKMTSGANEIMDIYGDKFDKAMFDSRVFTLPQSEVCNCFIWRQQDATRNSIQSVGQANFSHKELHGKNVSMIQDMLMEQKGINWNDIETKYKRGSCAVKEVYYINEGEPNEAMRTRWAIDYEIPVFTQDREYVDKYVYPQNQMKG